jgi:hypothetical protein
MGKRSFLNISLILVIIATGCVKETYNMNMLSKKMQLTPGLAISAVKGNVLFSDMVKPTDTIVFDQNKLVTLIFKKDSIVDLKLSDFAKGTIVKTAVIDPGTFDVNIEDIFSHITGDFLISNPVLKLNYSNSFPDTVKINLNVNGKRGSKTVNLNLAPFKLAKPNIPVQQVINSTYIIDKSNSNLPALISLPPSVLNYSGSAILTSQTKGGEVTETEAALGPGRMVGSLELDIPMELKINNLVYADTIDNFLSDKNNSGSQVKPEDFKLLQVNLTADNGFPLGVSVKMSLYDSATHTVKSSVNASGVLEPAPVDASGKASGSTKTTTVIEFNDSFFSSAGKADRIIMSFTLNSTSNGVVKIYSDYRIDFTASLVVKPVIKLN